MCVSLPHFIRCVPNEGIDDSLVDRLQGAIADEAVPEHMPAMNDLPLGFSQSSLEMIVCLILGKLFCAAGLLLAKRELPAGMALKPFLHHSSK